MSFWDTVGNVADPFGVFHETTWGSGTAAERAAQRAQGLGGPPQYPAYTPIYDKSMDITPGLRGESAGIGRGVQAEANRTGLSPVTRLRMSLAQQNVANQAAQDQGAAAAGGGLRAGQTAAIQNQAGRNALDANQQLAIADEQNRLGAMGTADQLQMQRLAALAQAQNADVNRQFMAGQDLNKYNLGLYGNQANIYGAGLQANAVQNSADPGGGLLGRIFGGIF